MDETLVWQCVGKTVKQKRSQCTIEATPAPVVATVAPEATKVELLGRHPKSGSLVGGETF